MSLSDPIAVGLIDSKVGVVHPAGVGVLGAKRPSSTMLNGASESKKARAGSEAPWTGRLLPPDFAVGRAKASRRRVIGHLCHVCFSTFKSRVELKAHQAASYWRCPACRDHPLFRTRAEWEAHMDKEHAYIKHECKKCGLRYISESVLALHTKQCTGGFK